MSFNGFLAVDPYLTFAEGELGFKEKLFVGLDGVPSDKSWYGEEWGGMQLLPSVWRLGREAYVIVAKKMGRNPTLQDFKNTYQEIIAIEEEFAPVAQSWIDEGVLVLHSSADEPPIKDLASEIQDVPFGWLIEVFMRAAKGSVVSGEISADKFPDFEGLLASIAVMYVDSCVIARHIDGRGLDEAIDIVQTNLASANLYRECINSVSLALGARAKKASKSRHESMNLLKAKLVEEWERSRGEYESRADFVRIVARLHGVKERTLYEWIGKHEQLKK
ncbi:hypothetical protein HT737_30085 [Pseudomonas sp. MD195_PC81_125]|uniref:hypothetical protein n=1 Tax=Pseudomonas sp. MD195_PC81_125 TaxID=2741560 RepID=UPI0015FA71E2|nr:hypothetical protein [Pseudomonas sp. MD195_PC81_125]MBA5978729.1 hypothetical protein [Pseudomonas sp. MD195_PC81_125]MBA5983663.1 hypothetical protein [Pseudomonas sp. MD195_PC81_125]